MELVLVDTRSGKRRTISLGALGSAPALLGSGIDCDVVVPSADVAEHACTASLTSEGIVLEALGSTKFLLNERPTKAAILHPGDVVKLGPFQLVAAGFARRAEPEAGPPEPTPEAPEAPELIEARGARDAQYAARRRNRKQNEALIGALILLLVGGAAAVLWQRGAFSRAAAGGDSGRDRAAPVESLESLTGASSPESGAPPPTDSEAAAGEAGVEAPADERGWRKPSSPEEVAATLAKVDTLLELQEYARCRWLLWQLAPTAEADRTLVEKRRAEVDAAAKKGGEEHLAFVDELVKKGKLPTALGHCDEDSIERFKGLAVWYQLLEKADEIEQLLNERVPETLRPKSTRKHARKMPADLDKRSPPPAKVSLSEEFGATDPAPRSGAPPRESAPRPPRPSDPGPEPASVPPPPTAEQLAAQVAIVAALKELAAAKPAEVEALGKKVADAAHAAKELAIAPLLARCDELATALESAPERAPLAELRRRVQALADARGAAIAFLTDEQRYPMLDPRAPGDVSRAGELAIAQKEADRLVDAVRAIWGSEQGSAPAPIVALSEETSKRVQEARLIDGLLAELGRSPPDRAELLATRLLPLGSPKITVRNYALDLDDRRRIDADRETKAGNQQIKEIKDADELELQNLTNAYREMLGRPQLAFDRKLYGEARTYAELMAAQAKSAKESDPQPEPTPRVAGTKPSAGANYLRSRASPRQALQAWCKVAGAHRNLLDPAHRAMAAANVGTFWAQLFGLLAPAVPAGK